METLVAILVGICLSASCGFRVFVPLLVASAASLAEYLPLSNGFEWIATWPALAAFAVASIVEIAAYYVPWLDNALDTIASPVGVIAGVLLFAASVTELDPFWHWALAILGGGGSAGVVQGATVVARAASTATTGGLANFVVNTIETIAGAVFSVLAIVIPIVALVLLLPVVAVMYYIGRRVFQRLQTLQDDAR
jgi:uncharacterized protein DUF4126